MALIKKGVNLFSAFGRVSYRVGCLSPVSRGKKRWRLLKRWFPPECFFSFHYSHISSERPCHVFTRWDHHRFVCKCFFGRLCNHHHSISIIINQNGGILQQEILVVCYSFPFIIFYIHISVFLAHWETRSHSQHHFRSCGTLTKWNKITLHIMNS